MHAFELNIYHLPSLPRPPRHPQHQPQTSVRRSMDSTVILSLHTSKNNDNNQNFVENILTYYSSARRARKRGIVGGGVAIQLGLEAVTEWVREMTQ